MTNSIALTVTAACFIGLFSERIDRLEDDLARLDTSISVIQQEVGKINENYARMDARLKGIEQSVERLTVTVEGMNSNFR